MKFEPYGPFELPRSNGGVDRDQRYKFWESIEKKHPSMPDTVGCYIFALKAAKGFKPWYVGMTEKLSLKEETWKPEKLLNYGEVIRKHKGTPVLFLLAKLTKKGRFAKPTKRKIGAVKALEEMLIAICLQRNSELLNKKMTRSLKGLQVPGYLNESPGARSKNAKALAKLLNT
jgi:hypothetical protein